MALTFEQFKKLREKGLTIEQIKKFEAGNIPKKAEPTVLQNIGNDLKNRASSFSGDVKEMAGGKINPAEFGVRTVGKAIGSVGDVFGEILAPAIKPVLAPVLSTTIGQAAVKAIKSGKDVYDSWKNASPANARAAKDIEGVINIASIFPATKTAQVGSSIALKSGKLALSTAGKVAEKTAPKLGKALEKTGEAVYKSAIPLSKSEAKAVQAFKADTSLLSRIKGSIKEPLTAGKTAMEKGFAGTESMIGVQAKREIGTIWEKSVKPALASIKSKIKTQDAFNNVAKEIAAKIKEPGRRNSLLEGLDAMRADYKDIPTMTHQFAQDIKSDLYKFVPEKFWKGKNVASAVKEVQAMFASELRRRTREALAGHPEALKAFDDYGNLKALTEFGQNAMTGSKKKGGFGSFMTSVYENASIPAKTVGGQALRKAGKLLQKK